MAKLNPNYFNLKASYLFPEIGRRTRAWQAAHPQAKLIRMGIGDVVLPIPEACRQAMHVAVDEMGTLSGFKGYGPEQGYDFLREAIAGEYKERGCQIDASEVFVSDGSKCDSGNIQEIFSPDARFALTDPVYPVYLDTNVMAGRAGAAGADGHHSGAVYLPIHANNGFRAELPSGPVDYVYLCSPNNPTGTVMTREDLGKWVNWALENSAVILFDAAYESYIRDPELPHSIYEIPGARKVAIEFRSFSKNAGFTGIRCGFIIVPQELEASAPDGSRVPVQQLWMRRHTTKFNGVSYPVQKGAAAVYTPEGKEQVRGLISYYMENARILGDTLRSCGIEVFGGENAPYIWMRTPNEMGSWAFFDHLLETAHVVGTPGVGFGPSGEGYFRLSSFALRENVIEAASRLSKVLK